MLSVKMSHSKKLFTRFLLSWVLYLVFTLIATYAHSNDFTLKIGVISPKGEGSSSILSGESHEESIKLAFSHLPPLQIGDLQIKLELIPWDDKGNSEKAAEVALHLAHEEQVVAILGPVNSGSTKAVLAKLREQQIDLPVISSLSTAPELTASGSRDKNFFRLIFDDADRMGQYATFIKQEKSKEGEQFFLFLYEDSPYGEGLNQSLKDRFYTPNIVVSSWSNVFQPNCSDSNNQSLVDQDRFSSGACLSEEFKKRLDQSNINNIVLLGDTSGALSIVNELKLAGLATNLDYFFVGSNKRLFDEAPAGSLTIGDPMLDVARAPTTELGNHWRKILDGFEERAKKDRADFIMTAYEAAMVLHSALHIVLNGQSSLPAVTELRSKLLNVLETATFDSLEPWRNISFSQGELDQIPTAPIYRITRGVTREDTLKHHPWIHLSVNSSSPWLETPVEVRLSAYGLESGKLGVFWIDEITNQAYLIEDRIVQFSAGQAAERFNLFKRGRYQFRMLDTPFYPILTETHIESSMTYLISAIAALIGAILVISRQAFTLTDSMIRVFFGIFTGLLLTFLSFYGQQLSSWIPLPSFGNEPIINAMVTGLIGGYLGPHFLVNLAHAWVRRFLITGKSKIPAKL